MPPRGSSPEPVVGMGLGRSWSIISNQGSGRDVPTAGTARRGQEGLASELLKSSLLLGGREQGSSEGRLVFTNGGAQRSASSRVLVLGSRCGSEQARCNCGAVTPLHRAVSTRLGVCNCKYKRAPLREISSLLVMAEVALETSLTAASVTGGYGRADV